MPNHLLTALKALADPTRLNIVAVLEYREANASEITRMLAQSQPRVSRHLKLLCDAEVLVRHQEGASAYFSLARDGVGAELVRGLLPLVDVDAPELIRARERLRQIRDERATVASRYFEEMAAGWDRLRDVYVGETAVEEKLLALLTRRPIRDFLDLGTGTGRILELLAPHFERGIGIDLSPEMLRVARANLDRDALIHCQLRRGDLYALSVPQGSADAVVLHHVLHFLHDPARAVAEAARTVRADGQLVIVDFAPHNYESLRDEQQHLRLGFRDEDVFEWCIAAGLNPPDIEHIRSSHDLGAESLEVTIWVATQQSNAPSHHRLEVA